MNTIDSLTRLFDRAAFDVEFPRQVQSAIRNEFPLAIVVVDIDRFKKVNDAHGHVVGDAVLREAALRIREVAEGKGSVYRYGGEEMVVILVNYSVDEATAFAERARVHLSTSPIEGMKVTASFGIACTPDHSQHPGDLFKAADAAMYDAKNRGRDLVRVYGEPAPSGPERVPDRKLPEPGQLTYDEKEALFLAHFQGEAIRCPRDSAFFQVSDISTAESARDRLLIRCPVCGLVDEIGGD